MALQKLASSLLSIRPAQFIIPQRITARRSSASVAIVTTMLMIKTFWQNLLYFSPCFFELMDENKTYTLKLLFVLSGIDT